MIKTVNNKLLNNVIGVQNNKVLKLIAWEVTKNCNLFCKHCRASSENKYYHNELNTINSFQFLDSIVKKMKPVVILTGGEPLLRKDIFDIAHYGTSLNLRMVMATNGTLITNTVAKKMLDSGIKRVSISIDGYNNVSHDTFRGVKGSFKKAMNGIVCLKNVGMDFQINTTITKGNFLYINNILELAERIGAVAHHIFFLIPTGRGKYCVDNNISKNEYKNLLNWFYEKKKKKKLELKATCAPQYYRLMREESFKDGVSVSPSVFGHDALTRGCLAGVGFCFLSHLGVVKPCGYTNIDCGNIISNDFISIWNSSPVFEKLRDFTRLKGLCGSCSYVEFCGGCRARSFEITGDYMGKESFCFF